MSYISQSAPPPLQEVLFLKLCLTTVWQFEHWTAFYTRCRPKSCRAIACMQHYFQQTGDQMPNRMAIHLSSFLNATLIYKELEEGGEEVICDT